MVDDGAWRLGYFQGLFNRDIEEQVPANMSGSDGASKDNNCKRRAS